MAQVFVWIRPGYKIVTVKLQVNVEAYQVRFLKEGRYQYNTARNRLSYSFSSQETPNSEWLLEIKEQAYEIPIRVSPSGLYESENKFVEPFLVKMSILNKRGEKALQKMFPLLPDKEYIEFVFDKKDLIECLQSDGSLTLCCKIFTHLKQDTASFGQSNVAIKSLNELSTHFGGLFNDMQLSDVNFKVCGREFRAHKLILAARSEVFAAMFEHPMKEQSTNQIEIEDIKPEVFQELLRFIYTGQVQFDKLSETMVVDLFTAADKYLLGQLKMQCENYWLYHMSPDVCVFLLLHGDLLNPAEPLKEAAKFLRRFKNEVMATDGWKKMEQENPVLFCHIKLLVFGFEKS